MLYRCDVNTDLLGNISNSVLVKNEHLPKIYNLTFWWFWKSLRNNSTKNFTEILLNENRHFNFLTRKLCRKTFLETLCATLCFFIC
jgi:hypothetical protein